MVIVGSPNVNAGYKLVNNGLYPNIAQDYERTFRTLRALLCDIFLGAHGAYYGMEAKFARLKEGGPNPFIDTRRLSKLRGRTGTGLPQRAEEAIRRSISETKGPEAPLFR